MIISKTPYRISFFGGGSDYPSWYNKYSGQVLSTTINKHIYITCRFLPKFFDHKYRVVWSKIENVQNIKNIKHPTVKSLLNHLKVKEGLEIHYDGDLPAASGMGSSSAFTVGLINSLHSLLNKKISNYEIAKKAINFEQKIMKEAVGSQDQLATAIGGFNKIVFKRGNKFEISSKKNNININRLEKNLLLIYTGKKRVAHDIAKKYSGKLTTVNKRYIEIMIDHVNEGEKIINSRNIDDFGKLLHSAWLTKKKLSSSISSRKIDDMYDYVLKNGALGGKLLGAGGGGFILFYMRKELKKKFLKNNNSLVHVPFRFSKKGSEILYKDLKR
ncbi:MAG: kinase [Candidatus Marinimicrobia bacterium]|nr:kinase [Candidatus Neomarinimicrobiota bacterium]|tara:strand:+ start:115 stop:1101 length:987 start_codon:yes stop_codon:yes gene_type:complete